MNSSFSSRNTKCNVTMSPLLTILGTRLGWVWPTFIVIIWDGGGGVVTIEYGRDWG